MAGATRHILLPAVTGMLPDIQMNSIRPGTVYPQGEKTVTIQGKMNELSSLKGSVNWDMYLVHTTSSHEVRIEKAIFHLLTIHILWALNKRRPFGRRI